jgi:hypothetical protein
MLGQPIAFGALSLMLRLNSRTCEAILLSQLQGKMREQNMAAFAYGVSCFAAHDVISSVSVYRGETAVDAMPPFPPIAAVA